MRLDNLKNLKINPSWKFKENFPTISAYTTSYNCILGRYPIANAIKSFSWADEVVVVDGGSTDGTLETLEKLKLEVPNLVIHLIPIDLSDPAKDGALKAISRAMCSSQFLVQFDGDELSCGDPVLWRRLAKLMPADVDIQQMFVAEPFAKMGSLRVNKEHNPLKWRMSRNKPEISHGIPQGDRIEKDGKVYSRGGSDGCTPVHIVNNAVYPSFVSLELQNLAQAKAATPEYQQICVKHMQSNPFVLHIGHLNLLDKIKLYLQSWHEWWCLLYNKDPSDPKNNVYFPNVKISDVSEEMIIEKVKELISNTPVVEVDTELFKISVV